jgi:hydroxylamine reductase
MSMFCNQCQETAKNTGCTINGVCGKREDTANLQDLLIFSCQGLAFTAIEARKKGIDTNKESRHIVNSLFMTITNANFDEMAIIQATRDCLSYRDKLKAKVNLSEKHDSINWSGNNDSEFYEKSKNVSILFYDSGLDIRAMKQYTLFGIKGMSAYAEHAFNLGFEQQGIYDFVEQTLVMITKPMTLNGMLDWVMRTGEHGVKVLALLDKANTSTFGNPEITKVNIGAGKNPGILVSGHDLKDLEELLIQTEGKGVDIYTHSEMLPSHAYPSLKKYKLNLGDINGTSRKQ